MRRATVMIVVLAILVLTALAGPASTVAARQTDPAAPAGPNVGDPVRVANFDRVELGTITVIGVEDPYEAAFRPPDPGTRLVFVCLFLAQTAADPIYVNVDDFSAVDAAGVVYDTLDPGLAPDDCPSFYGTDWSPGTTDTGGIVFQLPAGADLAQIVFAYADRLQPLVDLRPHRPRFDEPVAIIGGDGSEVATIAVSPPTGPGTPTGDDGYQFFTYPVSITNTGDLPFAVDPRDFYLVDNEGWETSESPRGVAESDPAGPYLQPNETLAPGASAGGLVRFRVRNGVEPVAVVLQHEDDHLVYLADSGTPLVLPVSTSAAIPPSATGTSPTITTPGCEGIVEWIDALLARFEATGDDSALAQVNAAREDDAPRALDPVLVRQAAAEARAMADEQAATATPAVAAEANRLIVDAMRQVAEHLDAVADALAANDQAATDAALAGLQSVDFDAFIAALEALGESCPELEEVPA